MQSGILLVDKPEGPSSSEVVERVKGILGCRKVGHLGTLDPFASGLLPLAIDEGTKIADIFLSADKTYSGVIALGVETDTQDATGRVVESHPVGRISKAKIKELESAFTGPLLQTPPMFSALKKGGVRLYRLAREGKSVPRSQREIRVERLKVWKMSERELGFELTCSKGTYIRTLAADMGRFLKCGAHLKSLRRLACGLLTLDQAVPLDQIEVLKRQGRVPILPLNRALGHIRAVRFENGVISRLKMGQQEALVCLGLPKEGERMVRVLNTKGSLAALAEWVGGTPSGRWRLFRVFNFDVAEEAGERGGARSG